jgi:hypothetical protein
MALSQVQIVNLALTKLGQDRVVAITDDTEAARVMRSMWDMTLDTTLASFPWKFAIKRVELAALADAPLGTEWTLQYTLPDECLRLVQVGEDWAFYNPTTPLFTLEGGVILSNEPAPLFVRYVQRITNVGLWPPLFGRVMAMQLAADASEKLTTSNSKFEAAMLALEVAVKEARRQNAIERPPITLANSDWLASRDD